MFSFDFGFLLMGTTAMFATPTRRGAVARRDAWKVLWIHGPARVCVCVCWCAPLSLRICVKGLFPFQSISFFSTPKKIRFHSYFCVFEAHNIFPFCSAYHYTEHAISLIGISVSLMMVYLAKTEGKGRASPTVTRFAIILHLSSLSLEDVSRSRTQTQRSRGCRERCQGGRHAWGQ